MEKKKFDVNTIKGQTHATIRAAFNNSAEIMCETGDAGSTNISGILTKLIQDVGRFSENWSSDCLYSIATLRELSEKEFTLPDDKPLDEILVFGIRRNGVDHDSYVMTELAKTRDYRSGYIYPERHYRRILAVRVRAEVDYDLHRIRTDFSLRDITHSLHGIETADLKENQVDVVSLPTESRENPLPQERYRVDKTDIARAKADGFKRFELRVPDQAALEELAKQGCIGPFRCVDVVGYYGGIVPETEDKGTVVCRCFKAGQAFLPVWFHEGYVWYNDVKTLVASVRDSHE